MTVPHLLPLPPPFTLRGDICQSIIANFLSPFSPNNLFVSIYISWCLKKWQYKLHVKCYAQKNNTKILGLQKTKYGLPVCFEVSCIIVGVGDISDEQDEFPSNIAGWDNDNGDFHQRGLLWQHCRLLNVDVMHLMIMLVVPLTMLSS